VSVVFIMTQGNAVYNILPDVISRLSDPDVGVSEEHFRIILKLVTRHIFVHFSLL